MRGFKFHPSVQDFYPNDRHGLSALRGDRRGEAARALPHRADRRRRRHARRRRHPPEVLEPDAARRRGRGFPRHADRARASVVPLAGGGALGGDAQAAGLHRPSGWSPKYFPPILVQYANTLLKDKILFGSDYPVMTPERWMAEFDKLDIKPEVRPLIIKKNAAKLLGLQVISRARARRGRAAPRGRAAGGSSPSARCACPRR